MIGIFGGSFDPIHFGHINPLNELSEVFDFKEIRLIPTYQSPANKIFFVNAHHRYNMVSIISSSSSNNFVADNIEILNEGISYTYETLEMIRKKVEIKDICLIMGLDAFLDIKNWYNYKKLINNYKLIIINRPNYCIDNISNMDIEIFNKITYDRNEFLKNEKSIYLYKSSALDISSTKIRDAILKGNKTIGLIPGSIMSYIKRNGLYTEIL